MQKENVTRAEFLKKSAMVGFGGAAALGVLAGCSAPEPQKAASEPAGDAPESGPKPTYTPYELSEIEAISQLQADYWWYMDTKQWEAWEDVFTEDMEFYSWGELATSGRTEFIDMNKDSLSHFNTAHQGHQHKVVLTSDTTAQGRWILNDNLTYTSTDKKGKVIKGYGYYINDYEKGDDGKWRIKVERLAYFRFEDPFDVPATLVDKVPYDTELS